MRPVKNLLVVAAGLALCAPFAGAAQLTLDRRAIEEAIFIGQSRIEVNRTRFHAPYRVTVARPPVDWIDVITPFHRVELAAEGDARGGSGKFGQREAMALLAETPGQIDLVIEMSFHPLNTFVGMPLYQVFITGPSGTRIPSRQIGRFPRFGPRADSHGPALPTPNGTPVLGSGQPILGGTILAAFDGALLNTAGRQELVVLDGTTELARATLDLGRMR